MAKTKAQKGALGTTTPHYNIYIISPYRLILKRSDGCFNSQNLQGQCLNNLAEYLGLQLIIFIIDDDYFLD